MTEHLIIAGSGGQGIMLLGKVIAEAAMRKGKHVTFFPAYGAEVRGGTAHCMVIISDNQIGSPYVDKADTLIIMNQPSLEKFKSRINSKGLVILNSSLAKNNLSGDLKVCSHPFTDIALKLNNVRVANMAALGCYLANKKLLTQKDILPVFDFMAQSVYKNLVEINRKALEEGIRLKHG